MTRFQKKEQDALAAFQKEMNQFGLYVNTRVFGGMYSDDEKYFCLEAGTNAQPVKGNKALIERIKAAGYIVVKSRQTDETGRNVYVFWVMKIYRMLDKMVHKFRVKDADGVTYFWGVSSDPNSTAPLDIEGAEYGCTTIQYKDPETGKYTDL